MRVFIALPLPTDVISKLSLWLEPLRCRHPNLRWVRPDQIHLTLRFLGDVGQAEIDHAERILDSNRSGPVEFILSRSGTFSGRGREGLPSVYWVGGEWGPEAAELADSLSLIRDDRGRVGRVKSFHPHLTIARQGRYNEKVRIPDPGPWKGAIDRVVIYSSLLTRSGPEHSELCSFRLST